jgi:hypothetical protein
VYDLVAARQHYNQESTVTGPVWFVRRSTGWRWGSL